MDGNIKINQFCVGNNCSLRVNVINFQPAACNSEKSQDSLGELLLKNDMTSVGIEPTTSGLDLGRTEKVGDDW